LTRSVQLHAWTSNASVVHIWRMTETFKKLNFKSQTPILVYAAPKSFQPEIAAMQGETEVHFKPRAGRKYGFAIAFAAMRADLVKAARLIAPLMEEQPVLWFAYPKQTSKAYSSDLNRDLCWEALDPVGLQAVRQIAVDDDWSALRFKPKG
jgi:hypothetical protein